jgi:hypothetical protein
MERILIKKDVYIDISDEVQTGSLGRPFRLSGLKLLPPQYINGAFRSQSIVIYRYLDCNAEFFGIKLGFNNEFIEKINRYEP